LFILVLIESTEERVISSLPLERIFNEKGKDSIFGNIALLIEDIKEQKHQLIYYFSKAYGGETSNRFLETLDT